VFLTHKRERPDQRFFLGARRCCQFVLVKHKLVGDRGYGAADAS
jgi:hypothetical protein